MMPTKYVVVRQLAVDYDPVLSVFEALFYPRLYKNAANEAAIFGLFDLWLNHEKIVFSRAIREEGRNGYSKVGMPSIFGVNKIRYLSTLQRVSRNFPIEPYCCRFASVYDSERNGHLGIRFERSIFDGRRNPCHLFKMESFASYFDRRSRSVRGPSSHPHLIRIDYQESKSESSSDGLSYGGYFFPQWVALFAPNLVFP